MSGFIRDPDWTPSVDDTNIKVTELSDFYTNEDGTINIEGVSYALPDGIRAGVTHLNHVDNQEEMKFLADQEAYRDRFFIENSRDENIPYEPLKTEIYFLTDHLHKKIDTPLYTTYHNGIPDIYEPLGGSFKSAYHKDRAQAYKDMGIYNVMGQNIDELFATHNAPKVEPIEEIENELHEIFINRVADAILDKFETILTFFTYYDIANNNQIKIPKFSVINFPSLITLNLDQEDEDPLTFLLTNGPNFGGKKYKNKIVNIPVIPEKKTRKNKKPKECYKNCESVPSGLCATGCKPSWTSKRKIRSRNWCHCNIDKTKCSIHICRSKTKKKKNKKNKKKYSKNKSRKSK